MTPSSLCYSLYNIGGAQRLPFGAGGALAVENLVAGPEHAYLQQPFLSWQADQQEWAAALDNIFRRQRQPTAVIAAPVSAVQFGP